MQALEAACVERVGTGFLPELERIARESLGQPRSGRNWMEFQLDAATDSPVVLFHYPSNEPTGFGYLGRSVKMEFGSLTDQRPVGTHGVRPWVAEEFPNQLADFRCELVALELERTFWEKATILHAEHHRNQEKPIRDRFSRHYSDIHNTYLANVARAIPDFQRIYEERILGNLDLISNRHGIVCFSGKENDILLWSHYTDSHRGMLLEFDTTHSYFTENSRVLKVCYSPSRVPWNPTWPEDGLEMHEYVEKVLCTKNTPWEYEQEWRSLHLLGSCHSVLLEKSPSRTLYFTDIPGEIIQRVVLGLRCPADMQRQVEEARAEHNLEFALCKAVLHPTEFRVEYKPI